MKRTFSLFLLLAALNSWGAVTGQLWYGVGYGESTDQVVGHFNSDDSDVVIAQRGSAPFLTDFAVDPAAGFYWGIDPSTGPSAGTPSSDPYALSILEYRISDNSFVRSIGIGDSSDQDVVNCLAIDPSNHVIYVSEWGYDQAHAGIEKVTYAPATGAMTGGSNAPVFLVNNADFSGLDLVEYMSIDLPNHKLYFVDNDNGYSLSPFSPDNAVYVVDYSSNNPAPIKLTSNASVTGGFPTGPGVGEGGGAAATDDPGGLLASVAVNSANQLVYFTSCQFTEGGTNTKEDAVWYVNSTTPGQTATKVGLPSGLTLNFPDEDSGLTFDPVGRHLYIADLNQLTGANSRIVNCTMSADGKSITSFTTEGMAALTDETSPNQDAAPLGTTFTCLPIPAIAASATYTNGNTPVALSPAMTVSAITGGYLRSATVSISAGLLSGDILNATPAGAIAMNYTAGAGTLTLTNYDSVANYQTVLRSVTYSSGATDPGNNGADTTRALTWVLNDGQPNIPAASINSSNMVLTIASPPAFTSAASTNFVVEVPGTFTLAASGYPKPTLSEVGTDTLPAGVIFTASTGVLSGIPAAGSGGPYTLHFIAQNNFGTNTQTFSLTVDQPPAVTCPSDIVTNAIGTCLLPSVSFAATATGYPAPALSYQFDRGAITPPATFPLGTNTVTCMASNVLGTNTCSFTITVAPGPGPQLTVAMQGTNLVLSWPGNAGCYSLQTSTNLAPGSWIAYPGLYTSNANSTMATAHISTNILFFRLKD